MEIFGKHIFGTDATDFTNLPILEQVEWIKKRTSQKNDDIINEFLANIPANNNKNCLNCGNISETIPTEVATDTKQIDNGAPGKRNSTKRQRNVKGA